MCSFTSDALAVAASGLVASEKNEEGKNEVAKTVVGLGLVLGIAQSTILYLLIHGGLFELFTNDPATLSSLRQIEPILVLCQPINSVSYVLDGVVQGRGEFKFQAKAMAVCAGVAGLWFCGSSLADSGGEQVLLHVWEGLAVLMGARLAASVFKLKSSLNKRNL